MVWLFVFKVAPLVEKRPTGKNDTPSSASLGTAYSVPGVARRTFLLKLFKWIVWWKNCSQGRNVSLAGKKYCLLRFLLLLLGVEKMECQFRIHTVHTHSHTNTAEVAASEIPKLPGVDIRAYVRELS